MIVNRVPVENVYWNSDSRGGLSLCVLEAGVCDREVRVDFDNPQEAIEWMESKVVELRLLTERLRVTTGADDE